MANEIRQTVRVLNIEAALTLCGRLLDNGYAFEVVCRTTGIDVTMSEKAWHETPVPSNVRQTGPTQGVR